MFFADPLEQALDATILYTLDCYSSTSKKKFLHFSVYCHFRTNTQNFVDSFLIKLIIIFSRFAYSYPYKKYMKDDNSVRFDRHCDKLIK